MPPVQNEFPQPANLRPPAPPADKLPATAPSINPLAALRMLAGQESFTLNPDLRMALEDMASAAEGRNWKATWPAWLQQMINESLRSYLGR